MKSTVEQLNPTRAKLTVEVPFDELAPDFQRAYASLADQVRIPGFRPGKAPAKLIEARVGREAVLAQVVNDAIPAKYAEAVEEAGINPIGNPDIELSELEYGESVSFTAEVDVRPELTLPDYSSLAVTVDAIEVDDDAVDEQLLALQQRFGTLTGVDRAIKNGDFVSIDLAATVDGKEVEEASTTGLSHEVGNDELIDGLDEKLIGMKAGETGTFTTTLVAGEYADSDAEVTVTVGSVKERELPEANDEFAEMASEFDTIDELKEDLRKRAGDAKKIEQANKVSEAVMDALLEKVEVPLPENLVEQQANAQVQQILQQLGGNEETFAKLLEAQDTTREDFEKDTREKTEYGFRTQLVLDAVADKAETEVSQDEMTNHILFQAQQYGVAPQEFVQQLQQSGQVGQIYAELRRSKALGGVVREATITDSNGDAVDTAEFFGSADDTDAEESND